MSILDRKLARLPRLPIPGDSHQYSMDGMSRYVAEELISTRTEKATHRAVSRSECVQWMQQRGQ